MQPFDWKSTWIMIELLQQCFSKLRKSIDSILNEIETKTYYRPEDKPLMAKVERAFREAETQFSEISKQLPEGGPLGSGAARDIAMSVSRISMLDFWRLDKSECAPGEPTFGIEERALHSELRAGARWLTNFERALYDYCKHVYTCDPDALPGPQRARLETIWSFDAAHEPALLGHYPTGMVDLDYGPYAEYEVLLELQSSDLLNWIWGDLYSLVIVVRRSGLLRNDFSDLKMAVTN